MTKYDSLEDLKKLPKSVQEAVAHKVGGGLWHSITVTRENGVFSYLNGHVLQSHYAPDYKSWEFHRDNVSKDPELLKIIQEEDEEYARWEREEGKDFDWEKLAI